MSEIKKVFTSRFEDGVLLELDFSQLEIFVLAYLSGDKQLKADLLSGADLHAISATQLFGAGFTSKQRKIAKQLSFQLQYGAGAKSMSETNGIHLKVAKEFIANYYARYTGVKEYHDELISVVKLNRETSDLRTTKGFPAGVSKLKSETGRQYTFVESDAPDFLKVDASFSPTKIKNYGIQGMATGDLVPMALGKLYRRLANWNLVGARVLMINTIHDSVMFDCESRLAAVRWAVQAKRIMESTPQYCKEIFGIDFDLPLPVSVEIGSDWYNMSEVDV